MGDSSQVHFFGDPGMEMMPECRGWIIKTKVKLWFLNDSTSVTHSMIWCPRGGALFVIFKVLESDLKCDGF